jgi:hypothetical protein
MFKKANSQVKEQTLEMDEVLAEKHVAPPLSPIDKYGASGTQKI